MASERMMQAIGTLERAVSKLELEVTGLEATPVPSSPTDVDLPAARAALRSLDDLIADLKDRTDG